MDKVIIVDKNSGYKYEQAKEKLEKYCKNKNINIQRKNILIVYSNSHEFVKEISIKTPNTYMIVNVTENLSEQHICKTLKYVCDICYLYSDESLIVKRIMKLYENKMCKRKLNVC